MAAGCSLALLSPPYALQYVAAHDAPYL